MEGIEKGIRWEVVEWRSPTDITIYDLEGNVLHTEKYYWDHEPIFGPDVDDCRKIDMILDRLIKQYGKEET